MGSSTLDRDFNTGDGPTSPQRLASSLFRQANLDGRFFAGTLAKTSLLSWIRLRNDDGFHVQCMSACFNSALPIFTNPPCNILHTCKTLSTQVVLQTQQTGELIKNGHYPASQLLKHICAEGGVRIQHVSQLREHPEVFFVFSVKLRVESFVLGTLTVVCVCIYTHTSGVPVRHRHDVSF